MILVLTGGPCDNICSSRISGKRRAGFGNFENLVENAKRASMRGFIGILV